MSRSGERAETIRGEQIRRVDARSVWVGRSPRCSGETSRLAGVGGEVKWPRVEMGGKWSWDLVCDGVRVAG
ncbi:hypothetical protein Cni_G02025 [Canna indica]|uniref:Uncharacterized protein n=1 Tax=Canna indica TaxID=4628 RepID=A0AAQ3JQ95_9LILI|nr:hypothetical protein Cni_G02025 [Canna indica]